MRKLAIPEDIMEKYLSALKLINESSVNNLLYLFYFIFLKKVYYLQQY